MRDDINIEYFRKCLQKRLKEINDAQNPIAPVPLDQTTVGRLSRMDAMQQQAMAQATARLAAQEQQRIRAALELMASGDYGYCIHCEEKIAEGRLKVDPAALSCIECARAAEKR